VKVTPVIKSFFGNKEESHHREEMYIKRLIGRIREGDNMSQCKNIASLKYAKLKNKKIQTHAEREFVELYFNTFVK
jgi:hypothetical protein